MILTISFFLTFNKKKRIIEKFKSSDTKDPKANARGYKLNKRTEKLLYVKYFLKLFIKYFINLNYIVKNLNFLTK
jgi:hypothetical protein